MAKIFQRVKGRKLEQWLAMTPEVQNQLDIRTFEIAVRAEALLIQHRQEGHAQIEIAQGDIDWFVVLSDERGQKAALSIEYGREAYYVSKDGSEGGETYKVGGMEGLFILHRAANLSKPRGKAKVKLSQQERRRATRGRTSR